MGNNASSNSKAAEAASGAYSPTPREENIYDQSFPGPPNSRYSGTSGASASNLHQTSLSQFLQTNFPSTSAPPVHPRGLERRSHTMVCREKKSESSVRFIVTLNVWSKSLTCVGFTYYTLPWSWHVHTQVYMSVRDLMGEHTFCLRSYHYNWDGTKQTISKNKYFM